MGDNDAFEINDKNLQKLIRALKGPIPQARVGILGSSTRHAKGNNHQPTNAEVGAAHEFGTSYIPMRSFLRMPINDNLQSYLQRAGAFDKTSLKRVINKQSMLEWVEKLAVTAEQVIQDAFASGGFGKWAPLSPKSMEAKKVKQILVETQQLRNSIVSEVK